MTVGSDITPDQLAALCASAMPDEGLTAGELLHVCWGDDRVLLGDERGAVGVSVRRFGEFVATWMLLLVVHPDEQRHGRARALIAAAEQWAREQGSRRMLVGGAVPWYLWPGVDAFATPALACFEAAGYDICGDGLNMALASGYTHATPAGVVLEHETGDGAGTIELCRRVWPHWEDEAARAIELGTCIAARNADGGTVGFGCHGVCRRGWIGPMGTDPDQQHGGVGSALLAALVADIRADGLDRAQISWVGPVGFYASAGAVVSRSFRLFQRNL
ncbi:MAG: GCN5-related N-acetyltransferase [Actinomycetia bacterium]|nr:GCN5-related N-acetyltransferase [Actinomycetes bacterium]